MAATQPRATFDKRLADQCAMPPPPPPPPPPPATSTPSQSSSYKQHGALTSSPQPIHSHTPGGTAASDNSLQAKANSLGHSPLPKSCDTIAKRCELVHILLSASLEAAKTKPESYDAAFLEYYDKKHMVILAERLHAGVPDDDALCCWHADEAAWARVELQKACKHQQRASPAAARVQIAKDVQAGIKMMFDRYDQELMVTVEGFRIYQKMAALGEEAQAVSDGQVAEFKAS